MTTTHTPSLPFPVTPRVPGGPVVDLLGFEIVHRGLRSGTREAAVAVTGVAAGAPCPPARHKAICTFVHHVLLELHLHHQKEDDVLWPVIEVSAGPHVDLAPLSDDHAELHALLVRGDDLLERFRSDPAGAATELGALLTELVEELDEHITEEEATVFPVIRDYVSAEDFTRCEKLFQKGMKLGHATFLLPWFFSQCTPAERAKGLATSPLPVRVILRLTEKRWQRCHALVVGA